MPMFPRLVQIVEARVERTGRHLGLRAVLFTGVAIFGIACLVFLLVAATFALSTEYGTLRALGIMAAAMFLIAMLLLLALQIEGRRYRRTAMRRSRIDSQLMQAAALSVLPSRLPAPSTGLGLGLVALGAFLVFRRR